MWQKVLESNLELKKKNIPYPLIRTPTCPYEAGKYNHFHK